MSSTIIRRPAAVRHLCNKGMEALKPHKVMVAPRGLQPEKEVWRRPIVSKRKANIIRKAAIRDGTYGSFDSVNGTGWDPQWDLALKANQYQVTRFGGIRPNKKPSRERNREDRAKALDANLETRLEKLDEYYTQKEQERVKETGIEAHHKRLVQAATKRR